MSSERQARNDIPVVAMRLGAHRIWRAGDERRPSSAMGLRTPADIIAEWVAHPRRWASSEGMARVLGINACGDGPLFSSWKEARKSRKGMRRSGYGLFTSPVFSMGWWLGFISLTPPLSLIELCFDEGTLMCS